MILILLFVFIPTTEIFAQTPDGLPKEDGSWFVNAVGNIMLKLAAWVTWFGGVLLDNAIIHLILGMGTLVGNGTAVGGAIDVSWGVIRDISNLAFIFGFVWIGIKTIIDNQDANTKKMLASLIVGALLINFSLFFTKVVIDTSNVLANSIYTSLTDLGPNPTAAEDDSPVDKLSISSKFMSALKLTSVYDVEDKSIGDVSGSFTFFFMASVLFLVTGFVFASGAFLLITRFVALIFIMIFSPILFAATVFPKTKGFATDLWGKLFAYSFFAPLYLLLLLISFKMADGFAASSLLGGTANKDFKSAIDHSVGTAGQDTTVFSVILVFIIIMTFLLLSLKIADILSIKGGAGVLKLSNNIKNGVQGYATRSALNVGRKAGQAALFLPRTAGRAAKGAIATKTLDKFNKFQARNPEGGVQKTLAATNLDRSIIGTLEGAKSTKMGLKHSYKENQEYKKERVRRLTQNSAANKRSKDLASDVRKLDNVDTSIEDFASAVKQLGKTVRNMSIEEKGKLGVEKLTNHRVATQLTDKDIEGLTKSGNFSEQQVSQIKTARKDGFDLIASHGDIPKNTTAVLDGSAPEMHNGATDALKGQQRQQLVNRDINTVGKLDHSIFSEREMQNYVTPTMVEARMKNGASNEQVRAIEANIVELINNPETPENTKSAWRKWSRKSIYGAQLNLD